MTQKRVVQVRCKDVLFPRGLWTSQSGKSIHLRLISTVKWRPSLFVLYNYRVVSVLLYKEINSPQFIATHCLYGKYWTSYHAPPPPFQKPNYLCTDVFDVIHLTAVLFKPETAVIFTAHSVTRVCGGPFKDGGPQYDACRGKELLSLQGKSVSFLHGMPMKKGENKNDISSRVFSGSKENCELCRQCNIASEMNLRRCWLWRKVTCWMLYPNCIGKEQ